MNSIRTIGLFIALLCTSWVLGSTAPAEFAPSSPVVCASALAPGSNPLTLEHAEPAPQAWVQESPERLILRFSADVVAAESYVHLASYHQSEVPGSLDQHGADGLIFTLEEPLEEATYEVVWAATAATGERAEGRYNFTYLVAGDDWDEPIDRRLINRSLGNLVPGWLLILPALAGAGGLAWVLWNAWRD